MAHPPQDQKIPISPNQPDVQEQQELFTNLHRVVYIFNLPYTATEEEIYQLFNGYHIEHVRIILTNSGHSNGTALAQLSSENETDRAVLNLNGRNLHDRPIRLTYAINNDIQNYRRTEFCPRAYEREYEYEYERRRNSYECFNPQDKLIQEMHEFIADLNAIFNHNSQQLNNQNYQLLPEQP